mmetsp:Transcript_10168/g.25514  ORF Transcript_10168/g.25514 Transcript_10168/m.25514 type:complete len:694 (-) Transcript_10168:128-2209(-)|eukprot:CAMPEP_0174903862 /NCGR_PEP_ID=MMETSP0167-20121228/46015_1 /TAXON_ID=38298 /ORGANISM="Rhodella maculata, Strain CCMP736" /LENGTH=693 /DNA_ID=CAMNT_0016146317 /DNA_START=45 /DNA_END=2126 /DNA_ORIENTATION=+
MSLVGSLYVSTTSPPTQKPIYLECSLSLRSGTPLKHDLLASQLGGDDSISELPSDLYFPVSSSMLFEISIPDAKIEWNDRRGRRYVFDCDDSPADMQAFRGKVVAALFEAAKGVPSAEASDAELREVLDSVDEEAAAKRLSAVGKKAEEEKEDPMRMLPGDLVRVESDMFRHDGAKGLFTLMRADVVAVVAADSVEVEGGGSERVFLCRVFDKNCKKVFEQEICNEMQAQFFSSQQSVVWLMEVEGDAGKGSSAICLSLKFKSEPDFSKFRNQFSVCLYEVNNKDMAYKDLKDYDQQYLVGHNVDDAMEVEEEEEKDVDDVEDDLDEAKEGAGRGNYGAPEEINDQLAVAFKNDRSFITRGTKMGVFKASEKGMDFQTAVDFKDKKGRLFHPSQMMLHEEDRRLLLRDPNDETKIMLMDLERGEVVEEYGGSSSAFTTPVKSIGRTTKYANMTGERTFTGLSDRKLMHFDPRDPNVVVNQKEYAASSRVGLSQFTATGAGHYAVAGRNGDIRLFDQIGKNAKSALPGLGDDILGLDVTDDGHYVLATTATYLLLIDTHVKGEVKDGFSKSITKQRAPPKKLQLRPQDLAKHRITSVSFTPAHFNAGSSLEKAIVTSTGPFIITWNLRKVKAGATDAYVIREYADRVVADEFAYDNDRIVVTLPNDVTLNTMYEKKGGRRSSVGGGRKSTGYVG